MRLLIHFQVPSSLLLGFKPAGFESTSEFIGEMWHLKMTLNQLQSHSQLARRFQSDLPFISQHLFELSPESKPCRYHLEQGFATDYEYIDRSFLAKLQLIQYLTEEVNDNHKGASFGMPVP